ncbi:MAG: HAD-IA family hydrolase [Acidobacteriaceae bacterium]|nr:HAD-IA family hydrolase [Acidobacteriaceae bacterium]
MLFVFDLDGTLIDSVEDLTRAVNATRAHFNMGPLSEDAVKSYVGHGATVLMRHALGPSASGQMLADGLSFFLDFYGEHALDYTHLYPGIRSMLDDLRSLEHVAAVLTNKPSAVANKILSGLGIAKHFFRVYGGDSLKAKKPDPVGVHTLINESATDRKATLVVGDSAVDVETARNAGVRSCGVTWGLQPHALEMSRPDILIAKPHQLFAYI